MKFDVHLRSGVVVTIERPDMNSIVHSLHEVNDYSDLWIFDDNSIIRVKQIDAIIEHVDIDTPIPLVPMVPPLDEEITFPDIIIDGAWDTWVRRSDDFREDGYLLAEGDGYAQLQDFVERTYGIGGAIDNPILRLALLKRTPQ